MSHLVVEDYLDPNGSTTNRVVGECAETHRVPFAGRDERLGAHDGSLDRGWRHTDYGIQRDTCNTEGSS